MVGEGRGRNVCMSVRGEGGREEGEWSMETRKLDKQNNK